MIGEIQVYPVVQIVKFLKEIMKACGCRADDVHNLDTFREKFEFEPEDFTWIF